MKNIMKIMLALLTSVSMISSATAGELTVTGSAKATYNILSGGVVAGGNQNKGVGLTNEIDFGATGELDNGYTWKYQVQLDPGATTTAGGGGIDDTRLELTTGYGTLGVYVSEGGLDVDNSGSQSVYGRPSDIGLATGMVDTYDISAFTNIQLHTPAGLLPFDAVAKVAYSPGNETAIKSGNAAGNTTADLGFKGSSSTQYQLKLSPIDGLALGADYFTYLGDSARGLGTLVQQAESGAIYGTYKIGAASFGISGMMKAPLLVGTSTTATVVLNSTAAGGNLAAARQYKNHKMSAAYNVNDALSISYEIEKSERELIINTAANDIKSQAIQAAYTMGGMTLSVSHGNTDNVGYAQDDDRTQTLLAMSMAF